MTTVSGLVIYECGICDCYHPWEWSGDCRDDANRFFPDEYAEKMGCSESELVIRTMDERVLSDQGGIHFDRYDICEAFNLLSSDYSLHDLHIRLHKMGFKASKEAEFHEGLTANGQAIYDTHALALDAGTSKLK